LSDPVDGLAVVDKPAGWTSHDVVARCRKVFGQKRVGHAGTLDPDATGVLLVGLGRVTRLMRFMTALPKTYTGEVVLGVETSTLDAAGDVVATHAMAVTVDAARTAAAALTGDILQVPPMVSAVKVGGQRLHVLARKGEEVEREPRPVTVHRFDVRATPDPTVLGIAVQCSSGTYVRVLAADLGRALGGGAHLRNLRRTAIGSFSVENAVPLESLTLDAVLPPAAAMRDYPSAVVSAEDAVAIGHGRRVSAGPDDTWAAVDEHGRLLAVCEGTKPIVVLAPA
jgi:tRNA pseudouridine55 synthase